MLIQSKRTTISYLVNVVLLVLFTTATTTTTTTGKNNVNDNNYKSLLLSFNMIRVCQW